MKRGSVFCAGAEGEEEVTAEGFDYMQAGKKSNQAAAVAQEYMDKLLHDSAPASYLPMLATMATNVVLPLPVRVCFHVARHAPDIWLLRIFAYFFVAGYIAKASLCAAVHFRSSNALNLTRNGHGMCAHHGIEIVYADVAVCALPTHCQACVQPSGTV